MRLAARLSVLAAVVQSVKHCQRICTQSLWLNEGTPQRRGTSRAARLV